MRRCLEPILARTGEEVRDMVQMKYRIEGSAVYLYEWRPRMDGVWDEQQLAKFRYFASREHWVLYWMRGTGEWEPYLFPKSSKRFSTLALAVQRDVHC